MLFALLALRADKTEISLNSAFSALDSFGFTTNGHYSLTVHSSTVAPIVFGLLSSSELKNFDEEALNDTAVLDGDARIAEIQSIFSVSEVTIAGGISTKGVYTVFAYIGEDSEDAKIVLSADFSNGDSRLDYRTAPSLIERPIALGFFSVLLVLWLVNWFLNSNLRIYIHYCLTGMYIAGVVARAARVFYIYYTDKNDFSVGVQAVSLLFRVVFEIFLYVVILLCAKGWCIVRQRIRLSELARAVSLAVVFLVTQTVGDYATLGNVGRVICVLIMLVALGFYARELIRSSHLASMYIYAYLLEISNSGIDPETTPIWEKMQMFEKLQYCIIIYVSLLLIHMIVSVVVGSYPWVTSLTEDIADFGGVAAIAFVYRLRGGSRNGFTLIDDDNGIGELMLADIEAAPEAGRTLRKGGRKWETGMALPPPPGSRQNVITIETPDGTFEIAIRVDPPPEA
jgi:hypothetical protein